MDKLTKQILVTEVRSVLREALETDEEKWVSEKTLREHFELFTPFWLRTNKHKLGAVQIPGTKGWSYPLHAIQRRFKDGSLFQQL